MLVDLQSLRAQAGNHLLVLEARGLVGSWYGHWGVPGSAVIGRLLQTSIVGLRPRRWFSQVDAASPGLHPRYRWSTRAVLWGSRLARHPVPAPRHVPANDPEPIVRWLQDCLDRGKQPHLGTFPSSALRICQTALALGVDLTGSHFTVAGEPMTEARLHGILRAGASVYPLYGSSETGLMGWGCLAPEAADDMHFSEDMHAFVQWSQARAGEVLPDGALLVTSLQPNARLILLNASLGDQAHLSRRACGCPLEAMGWPNHLRSIRSFEKLTAGGMTFLDNDVTRVLEEVLPSRFGGGPTDYQIVEREDADGTPTLRLLVSPAVGAVDDREVAEVFLTAIGRGSGVERVMQMQWRQAGTVRIERRLPMTTASGKLLHLYRARSPVGATST
jgi:hypothetical protein